MSDSFFSPPRYWKSAMTTTTTTAEAVRCMSPDLFPAIYNPADYKLQFSEYEEQNECSTLGFECGQRFPWQTPTIDSPCILNLLSGVFTDSVEIENDAQSFHFSDYDYTFCPSSDEAATAPVLHWKKKMISRFH